MIIVSNQRLEEITELSLVVSLPQLIMDINNVSKASRTASLLKRLNKHAANIIKKYPYISDDEVIYSYHRLDRFFTAMQWQENSKNHVVMILSFLLGLVDYSTISYPQKIVDALNDLFQWITREEVETVDNYIEEAERALKIWRGQRAE